MDKRPVILLNMAVMAMDNYEHEIINSHYVRPVSDAGAVPMLIPSLEKSEIIETLLDMADGVVLIGGRDYDPAYYGEEVHPETQTDRLRPHFDIAFGKAVLERRMPVMGICAGCQLLNIVSGGKLIQHVDNVTQHRGGVFHRAEILKEGFFSRVLGMKAGDGVEVNSFHHQAVDPAALGKGFEITARAFDGGVEVIEQTGSRMVMGVQFHPERMADIGPGFFSLLKSEAEKFRRSRNR